MSLEVLILGTAAGGGLPQWNCGCENCALVRCGRLPSRLQSGVAIRVGERPWVLVNASPDISDQVEVLNRRGQFGTGRFEAFGAVLLTNGDLDHALGLLQLREGGALTVVAPEAVRIGLEAGLRMDSVLSRYGGISWRVTEEGWRELDGAGIEICAIPIPEGGAPKYLDSVMAEIGESGSHTPTGRREEVGEARSFESGCASDLAVSQCEETGSSDVHGVGYLIREIGSPRVAGIFPDVPELTEPIREAIRSCDLVLFDGTFWTDDELVSMGYSERTSRQMGHIPISGPGGSLEFLGSLRDQTCAYMHINNTNPMLQPDSNQRRELAKYGVRVADDGDQFFL